MNFITTDGKLILDGTTLKQKKLIRKDFSIFFMTAYFIVFFLNSVYDKIKNLTTNSSRYDRIYLSMVGLGLVFYVGLFMLKVFKEHSGKKIDLSKIDQLKTFPGEEKELETMVMLIFRSGRFKTYSFRTHEKQAEPFITAILSIQPKVQVIHVEG